MVRQLTSHDEPKKLTYGARREQEVYNLISRWFPNALKEVYVHRNNSQIVEIDIAVVHTSGIYIFEVKTKRGKIFGSPNDKYWVAQHSETKSSKFFNPLKQTESHVRNLSKLYRISPLSCYSFIVFTDRVDISGVEYRTNQTAVCLKRDLPNILNRIKNNKNTPISPFVLDDIYQDLSYKSGVEKYREIHKSSVIQKRTKRKSPTRRTW